MPKARKTKSEKIESGYRLHKFKLDAVERGALKDANEFGYLSSEYVIKDLTKTLLYTLIVVSLLAYFKLTLNP